MPGTAEAEHPAVIADVRIGAHAAEGYDRVVFEFEGSTYPALTIAQAEPPFARDGSGAVFDVSGSSFLAFRLSPATRAGGYSGANALGLSSAKLVQLVEGGDFESVSTWVAGLTGPGCVHASTMASPARLVIDIERP